MDRCSDYQPKDGDVLGLGSKGRYGLCGWQVKLCESVPYLSTLEVSLLMSMSGAIQVDCTLLIYFCYWFFVVAGTF